MKLCESCGACFDDVEGSCGFDGGALHRLFPGARVIGGRYLLEQRISSGAMGIVVRATHLQVGSTVAVKLMRPAPDRHVALARFQREAQVLGRIKHPNAVLVIDFGVEARAGEAVPYLVMEYLRGESLLVRLEKTGPLSLAETERLLSPLCDAVEEAHQVGVIHRDLKPSNVMLERLRDGTEIVKVLDFGIAKFIARGAAPRPSPAPVSLADGPPVVDAGTGAASMGGEAGEANATGGTEESGVGCEPGEDAEVELDELDELDELAELLAEDDPVDEPFHEPGAEEASTESAPTAAARPARMKQEYTPTHDPTTSAGMMIGTVPYMAQEQMSGERVTRAADVHAVGVMAFQCLSGRLPYEGDDDDVITAKLADERPSLRDVGVDVPAALDELLQRCFARDPAERPASARALAEALREAAGTAPSTAGAAAEQMRALGRSLARVESAMRASLEARVGEDHYARARDLLLSVDAPLHQLRVALANTSSPADRQAVAAERAAFEAGVVSVRRSLARLGAQRGAGADELADYLRALWHRLDVVAQDILDDAATLGSSSQTRAPLSTSQLFTDAAPRGASLADLADRLLERDPLEGADALDELVSISLDAAVRALGRPVDEDALADRLLRGLWRHADALVLHELSPARRAFRLLPMLAELPHPAAAPFAVLARLFSAGATPTELAAAFGVHDREARIPLLRCMLLHSDLRMRQAAVTALEPASLWTVIAHPATPLHVERFLFEQLQTRTRSEYLKVFFFCVRDNLLAASTAAELEEALAITRGFFAVSCFHEDIVFEPLLELERALREHARGLRCRFDDGAYAEALAGFTAGGATETKPIESLVDVPLPIQRKLARDGHFLSFFVSHTNERVARETVPHLLRHDDVTPFLRIVTIHRVVLTELGKRRRFFRKDAAKLALLENPKTPAGTARAYLHLVSAEQLRLLAINRHINPDVRRMVASYLER